MNKGLSEEILKDFSNISIVGRPLIQIKEIPNSKWISGFVEAEGSFKVSFREKPNNKYQILIAALRFN